MSDWNKDWERLVADTEVLREVEVGRTSAALAQLVGQRMEQLELTQAELARRLGSRGPVWARKNANPERELRRTQGRRAGTSLDSLSRRELVSRTIIA